MKWRDINGGSEELLAKGGYCTGTCSQFLLWGTLTAKINWHLRPFLKWIIMMNFDTSIHLNWVPKMLPEWRLFLVSFSFRIPQGSNLVLWRVGTTAKVKGKANSPMAEKGWRDSVCLQTEWRQNIRAAPNMLEIVFYAGFPFVCLELKSTFVFF